MKKEVSLDPEMRRLCRPLPLFLTPEAPGRVIRMRSSSFQSGLSEEGLFLSGSNLSSEEGSIWPSPQ